MNQEPPKFNPPYAAPSNLYQSHEGGVGSVPLKEGKSSIRKEEGQKQKSLLLTILFLSVGSCLFTLGLLIFFLSENGKLILEWKSRYSLFYCLIAAPFLYIGWLRLKNE